MKLLHICLFALAVTIVASATTYARVDQSCSTTGQFWNTQTCLKCQSEFCSCTTYDGCDKIVCPNNQAIYEYEGNIKMCVSCPNGCSKCTIIPGSRYSQKNLLGFKCTECASGYQLSSGSGMCFGLDKQSTITATGNSDSYYDQSYGKVNDKSGSSISICAKYDDTGSCIECSDNSFLNESLVCESCMAGCSKCDSRGTCKACQAGTFWKLNQQTTQVSTATRGSGGCEACVNPFTLTCDATGAVSLTCYQGYFLSSGTCSKCIDNCVVCSAANTCTTCSENYYYDSNACKPCPGNEAQPFTCKTCATKTKCDVCQDNYQFLQNKCQLCTLTGCAVCAEANNAIVCQTCSNGFYKATAGTCTPCSSIDANATLCYQTDKGTNLDKPVITQCRDNFWLVQKTGSTAPSDLVCVDGTGLNCNLMVDQTKNCKTCLTNYLLFQNQCVSCISKIPGCTECDASGAALKCKACQNGLEQGSSLTNPNYVLNGSTANCDQCGSGCKVCSNSQTCTSCMVGQVLSSGTCRPCNTANCATCSTDTNTCLTCMSGYYVPQIAQSTTSYCFSCPNGCSKCDALGQKCTECLPNYYKHNDGCRTFTRYCAVLKDDGTCDQCAYAFRKTDEGLCLPCVDFYGGFVCGVNAGQECSAWMAQSLSYVLLAIAFALLV